MPAHHGWSVTATARPPRREPRAKVVPTRRAPTAGSTRRDDVVRQLPCRTERPGRDAA